MLTEPGDRPVASTIAGNFAPSSRLSISRAISAAVQCRCLVSQSRVQNLA
jgi:hypothetical protein